MLGLLFLGQLHLFRLGSEAHFRIGFICHSVQTLVHRVGERFNQVAESGVAEFIGYRANITVGEKGETGTRDLLPVKVEISRISSRALLTVLLLRLAEDSVTYGSTNWFYV